MPGTYYIRVYDYSKQGGYVITCNYPRISINGITTNDTEPNDNYSNSMKIATFNNDEIVESYGHLGYYTNFYTDTEDWLNITLNVDGKLIIKTEPNNTLELDLYIIDSNGESTILIYKFLRFGSPEFAEFLHNEGYQNERKAFKFFTFGLNQNLLFH